MRCELNQEAPTLIPPTANRRTAETHHRAMELAEKAKNKQPWDDADREALATAIASLALIVQDLLIESKRPNREMPVLPRR